jgi:hypothetical protein
MLTIITVFKSGGAFTEDYVLKLRRGVKKHLAKERWFICLTDTVKKTEFDKENDIQWEPLKHGWPAWYAKAELFRPDMEQYGRMMFIDLSSVIVGDLSEMAGYCAGVCVTEDFWHGGPSQSVLSYRRKDLEHVWDRWIADPDHWMRIGNKMEPPHFRDQVLMSHLTDLDYWQTLFQGQVVSYKNDCSEGIPENARIVKFHGRPKPHEVEDGWVKHIWHDELERVDFIPCSNVEDDVSLSQSDKNSRLKLPWIVQVEKKHDTPIAIVGGGPSLKEGLGMLRLHVLNGGHVWALNGVHDYLIHKGIIPDAMVMLDSRKENAGFVQSPHKDVTYYIAARCHPDVFKALEGYNVVVWHSIIDEDRDVKIVEDCAPFRKNSDKPVAQLVGGGSTVGLRAMYLAWWILGYTKFHIYGMDSSYKDGGHAYKQTLNDNDKVIEVTVEGQTFVTTPWMANQAKGFREQMTQMVPRGCEVRVYGDGLLPFLSTLGDPASEQSQS